jgi:hypothetical protein
MNYIFNYNFIFKFFYGIIYNNYININLTKVINYINVLNKKHLLINK